MIGLFSLIALSIKYKKIESNPPTEVVTNPRVTIQPIKPFPSLSRKLFLLYVPFKLLYQIIQLLWVLLVTIPAPNLILVQVRFY